MNRSTQAQSKADAASTPHPHNSIGIQTQSVGAAGKNNFPLRGLRELLFKFFPTPNPGRISIILLFSIACVGSGIVVADEAAPKAFREGCAKKAEAGDSMAIAGLNGGLFLRAELRHIGVGAFWGDAAAKVSKATKSENADPLPAILDFKKQLDAAGIDLILVPVPAKAFVYPEALTGGAPAALAERLDSFHQQFYEELRRNGVNVIDLLPNFLAKRGGDTAPLFCKQDTHWSGMGTVLASEKMAAVLKSKPWFTALPKIKTKAEIRGVEIKGDLGNSLPPEKQITETLKLRFVSDESGSAVMPSQSSPIVLLGDSHTLVFHAGGDMLASGAGLPDQLAYELGMPVDLIGVRGSGATPARINLMRRIRGNESYLAGKKAVIWCFTVREFTESSGWAKVKIK